MSSPRPPIVPAMHIANAARVIVVRSPTANTGAKATHISAPRLSLHAPAPTRSPLASATVSHHASDGAALGGASVTGTISSSANWPTGLDFPQGRIYN